MWFRKKNKQQEELPDKKKTGIEKLVMGAIIGVAVGSVVGMTIAPQKGSDTRKMIAEKGREAMEKSRAYGAKKGLMRRILGLVFGRDKRKPDPLKKIPNEQPAEKGQGSR